MTTLIFDKESARNEYDDEWTTGRLNDEFVLCLEINKSKYYGQAKDLMFRIPLTEQYPTTEKEALPFVINLSDLSPKVQEEFQDYCKARTKKQVTVFLKEVVIRIFENLDYDYAHMSVMRKLRIKLVKS